MFCCRSKCATAREPTILSARRSCSNASGSAEFSNRFPDELSGGMNQRAAICRALIHDPELLIMDEPFGALDAMTRDQMALDFHHLSREEGKSVLFVTHSISEAIFLSQKVVVMSARPGQVAATISIDLGRERHLDLREEPEFTRTPGRSENCFSRWACCARAGINDAAAAARLQRDSPGSDHPVDPGAVGCLWQICVRGFGVPIYLVPAPTDVWDQ